MRFATPLEYDRDGQAAPIVSIVSMGLALAVAGIVRSLAIPAPSPVVALELFVSLLVPTGLATGGYWLADRNASPDVRWQAATRVSIGIVVACGLGLWLVGYVSLEGGTIRDPLSLVTTLAGVGGATGFVTAVAATPRIDPVDSGSASAAATDRAGEDGETGEAVAADSKSAETPEAAAAAADPKSGEAAAASIAAPASNTGRSRPDDIATRPTGAITARGTTDRAGPGGAATGSALAPSEPASSAAAVAAVPSTTETALEVLRDERARVTLASLYHDTDGTAQSVDDLARVVAEHTDESAEAAAVSLRHATLPRLRAIRAVDWDRRTDRVAASDHAVFEEAVRDASALLESFEPGTR